MAGKNDCGKAGKGWRETGGGKKLARTYGGKGFFIIEGQGFCIVEGQEFFIVEGQEFCIDRG